MTEQKQATREKKVEPPPLPAPARVAQKRGKLLDDIDSLLDEIDEVLAENDAQAFVDAFKQINGQ
jgi:ubiquitin-like protein Pup